MYQMNSAARSLSISTKDERLHTQVITALNADRSAFISSMTADLTDSEVYVFFFSSRRRHTRCSRDWSSDVCSSDLVSRNGYICRSRRLRHHQRSIQHRPQPSGQRTCSASLHSDWSKLPGSCGPLTRWDSANRGARLFQWCRQHCRQSWPEHDLDGFRARLHPILERHAAERILEEPGWLGWLRGNTASQGARIARAELCLPWGRQNQPSTLVRVPAGRRYATGGPYREQSLRFPPGYLGTPIFEWPAAQCLLHLGQGNRHLQRAGKHGQPGYQDSRVLYPESRCLWL